MPNNTAEKSVPANKQKGKKVCSCCGSEKRLTDFYVSKSPLFALDGRVPICKNCIASTVVSDDTGEIDVVELNKICRKIDRPFFKDSLASSYTQFSNEHSYVDEEELKKYGKEILSLYFKNIAMRQDINRCYEDSEKENFMHQNNNKTISEKKEIQQKYSEPINIDNKEQQEERLFRKNDDFEVTDEMMDKFGDGYTKTEYKNMVEKYGKMRKTYVIQTTIHEEALATYVRFKVKEEMATARGDVQEAQKWNSAAKDAAEQGKLTAKQLSKEDLQGGIVNFSDIFKAVEGEKERIKIFPEFKYQPKDAADFIIWDYVNYERNLNNLSEVEYEEVYKFYDRKKEEYIRDNGDPYGIFTGDTTDDNRETIKKFITIPPEFRDGDE